LQSTPSDEIELNIIDYLRILEFLDGDLEKFNGIGEVHEVLDKFMCELVGQCEFIGSSAAIKRLEFLLKLRDMVLVDDIRAHDLSINTILFTATMPEHQIHSSL
jgi:hypothetical protein